jgi:hypothetical protein
MAILNKFTEHAKNKDALIAAESQIADFNIRLEEAMKQLEELPNLNKSLNTAESSTWYTVCESSIIDSIVRGKESSNTPRRWASQVPKGRGARSGRWGSLGRDSKVARDDCCTRSWCVHSAAIRSLVLTLGEECEERRRDVAALEYKLFELEKQEDGLRAQAAEVPRLHEAIAGLESG